MSRIKLSVRLRNKFDQILMKYEDETKMDEMPLDLQHRLTILLRKIPGKEITKLPPDSKRLYKFPIWEAIAKAARIASLAGLWDVPASDVFDYLPSGVDCLQSFQKKWNTLRRDDTKNSLDFLKLLLEVEV